VKKLKERREEGVRFKVGKGGRGETRKREKGGRFLTVSLPIDKRTSSPTTTLKKQRPTTLTTDDNNLERLLRCPSKTAFTPGRCLLASSPMSLCPSSSSSSRRVKNRTTPDPGFSMRRLTYN